jgi:putative heme-binding domain-containing protein
MLWHRGALYVTVNEKIGVQNGVYKVTDSNGDGRLDKVEQLREIQGGGEHGLHSLVPSPDGEWIYMICGNHTTAPEMDHYWMPRNWGEDHLLPRNPDGRGHARNTMAPGGWVCRFKPDNSRWELVASGFRNPFDLAFNEHGDLFAYDADMEWDLGMPWYRPTRLCHVLPGAEFGWRNGTGKWPVHFEDSLPPVVDIGPGSPTGAVSGLGARFPARYQKAIYLLDWTFATIYAVHLAPDGSSYTGSKEEFVAGPGLPLTDAEIGKDGAMYFMTGGRRTASALWRVVYGGDESTTPVEPGGQGPAASGLAGRLRGAEIGRVVEKFGSEDRFDRFLARVEAERRPIGEMVRAIGRDPGPWQAITGAIAVARQGSKEQRPAAVQWLGGLDWESLSREQRLGMLRAHALIFSRMGAPGEAERKGVLARINGRFPAQDDELDAELCRVLCYLQAPKVVNRTLRLMAAQKDTVWPDWAELATRNAGYGKAVLSMLRNSPPAQDIHYALCLRNVKGPWTTGQRRQIMEWYAMARSKSGGNSYGPFLDKMQKDMLENATPEERELIAGWNLATPRSPFEDLPQPEGPGRNWTVAEVAALGRSDLSGADHENGKRMFRATLCAACHRVEGEGGGAGPDLTAVGGRFKPQDIADAIIEPGRVISDQYHFHLIEKKDGSSVWGRQIDEKDGALIVAVNAYDFSQTVKVPRSEIAGIEPSPVSPMPGGLINRLNESELKDLLAFLLRR